MKTIINGIIKENPTFVLLLGLCPALAVTTKVENAYLMGICVLIVLILSSFVVTIIKKIVPDSWNYCYSYRNNIKKLYI